jgi:peptidoglycan-associated lipoprotein
MRIWTLGGLASAAIAALAIAGCAQVQKVGHIVTPGCQDASLSLYFESGSDALTDAGAQIVTVTAKRLKSCTVKELRLTGLADAAGSPAANIELSQRRADHVLAAFVRAGLPTPKYNLVAAGDQGAVKVAGVVEPLRRRVDVTVVVSK